jgi:hypothetical protein
MPEQVDSMKRVVELGQEPLDLRANGARSASHQSRDRSTVAPGDVAQQALIGHIATFGQPSRFDQLIRDSLERRDNDDNRLVSTPFQENPADFPNPCRRGERRAPELEHSHSATTNTTRQLDGSELPQAARVRQ